MKLLRRPISASGRIPDSFCVISMEFLSLSRQTFLPKCLSAAMSDQKRLLFASWVHGILEEYYTSEKPYCCLSTTYKKSIVVPVVFKRLLHDILLHYTDYSSYLPWVGPAFFHVDQSTKNVQNYPKQVVMGNKVTINVNNQPQAINTKLM